MEIYKSLIDNAGQGSGNGNTTGGWCIMDQICASETAVVVSCYVIRVQSKVPYEAALLAF